MAPLMQQPGSPDGGLNKKAEVRSVNLHCDDESVCPVTVGAHEQLWRMCSDLVLDEVAVPSWSVTWWKECGCRFCRPGKCWYVCPELKKENVKKNLTPLLHAEKLTYWGMKFIMKLQWGYLCAFEETAGSFLHRLLDGWSTTYSEVSDVRSENGEGCAGDVIGLYLAFLPPHTLEGS